MHAALLAAAKSGDDTQLTQLLMQDASLIRYTGQGTADAVIGNSPAHWAAAKGHANTLTLLIDAKADIHARNNGDTTPLGTAVMSCHVDCVRVLLAARADPCAADEFGDSPLSLAERAGDSRLIELLRSSTVQDDDRGELDMASCKERGNDAFKRQEYDDAIKWYTAALDASLQEVADSAGGESSEHAESRAALYSNRSACHAALRNFERALEDGHKGSVGQPVVAQFELGQVPQIR